MEDFIHRLLPGDSNPMGTLLAVVFCVILPCLYSWWMSRRKRKRKAPTGLDVPLFSWGVDVMPVRSLLDGGVHAFGRTGSGKTSSFKQLAKKILDYQNGSLLVLCAKKGEYYDWIEMAKARGREVMLLDPSQKWRLNLAGYEGVRGGVGAGIAANIVRFIMTVRSIVFRESDQTGGEAQFWQKQDERLIAHAVRLLQLSNQAITPANIQKMILAAPQSGEEMATDKWMAGFCNQAFAEACTRTKTPIDEHDLELATDFFLREWPSMAVETRGSVLVGTLGTLSLLNSGIAREMFGDETNWTPAEAIAGKKIVIVNMPPDEWGDIGLLANIGIKVLWQAEILRRDITAESPIAGIWGDESSLWMTPSDTNFLSRCRSARGYMVYLCQALSSYRYILPGEKANAAIEGMLANFSHKVFFALGDFQTAEWAANFCGKTLQQFMGGSTQHSQPADALYMQPGTNSSSFSEHYEYLVHPRSFIADLRTGSPVNDYMVDALVVRSGVPFANGFQFTVTHFDQRK